MGSISHRGIANSHGRHRNGDLAAGYYIVPVHATKVRALRLFPSKPQPCVYLHGLDCLNNDMPIQVPPPGPSVSAQNIAGEYTASMSGRLAATVIDELIVGGFLLLLQALKLINLQTGGKHPLRDSLIVFGILWFQQAPASALPATSVALNAATPVVPTPSPAPIATPAISAAAAAATSKLTVTINGKTREAIHLGESYKFEITNIPPGRRIIGRCEGASGCASWFLLSVNDLKPEANGSLNLPVQLAPKWNIPLTTYTLWVETDDGSSVSNRVSISVEGEIKKKPPFPPAAAGAGLQLLVSDGLEISIELGAGNASYHVDGGLPGQLLIAHCDWPPELPAMKSQNNVWLFPAGYKLDDSGKLDTSMGFGASMPAGKYIIWLTTEDGKFTSNKVTINLVSLKK